MKKYTKFQEELIFIKMDWFTEDNADEQIGKIEELFERENIELWWKSYIQIWEEAMGYLI